MIERLCRSRYWVPQLAFCSITNCLRALMVKIITISCSYIYTMEYYWGMTMNTFQLVLMRWMNLEPIIQSEINQKEKNKYHKLICIYIWNLERWYWWACLQGSSGDTDIENRHMDIGKGGKEREDETNRESSNIHYHV